LIIYPASRKFVLFAKKVNETIILTLTPHSVWGYILQPVVVTIEQEGWLTIRETAESKNPTLSGTDEVVKEIVRLSGKYSDKTLMRSYSKEKTVTDFLKNVRQDTVEKFIRPCIESYQRKIIHLLQESKMPLYIRKAVKDRTLYEADRINIPAGPASAVFYFIKEDGFRYFIRVGEKEQEEIDLFGQRNYLLCQDPAVMIVNDRLLIFQDIDAKKLVPFFSKKHIDIPASSEANYLKTFVSKCLIRYTVKSEGLDIRAIEPAKRATLSLEKDWNNLPVLILAFFYDKKKVPINHTEKKIVLMEETDGQTSLTWFYPDKNWESEQVERLLENGLVPNGLCHFSLDKSSYVDAKEEEMPCMIDWIREHPDVMRHYEFSQQMPGRGYFTGETTLFTETITGMDWFDLHCTAVFDTVRIPFVCFRQHILDNIREYMLPDGSIAILPKEWFSRYYELMLFGKKTGDSLRLKKSHFRLVEEIRQESAAAWNFSFDAGKLLPEPSGLNVQLRPYQRTGYSWLVHLYENNFGGCLADDMGLGKTVQTIALLQYLANREHTPEMDEHLPSLIVMPTSLLHNWQNELRRFAPSLKICAYSGAKRIKSKDIHKVFGHYDVVLTTYGTLRNDVDLFRHCLFNHLILDESQYVKNPGSQAHQSVKRVNALHKIALTGTPVENSLIDLWALFDIVNEGFLGSQTSFRKAYLNPINKNNPEKEEALLRLIQPFILRRTKEAVTPELPPLLEETVYCDMSEQQLNHYTTEKNKLRNLLSELTTKMLPSQMAFTTLQGLTKLRLLANHPVLLENGYTGDSGKFDQILMRFETLLARNHKVLIFSSFVKHLRILANHFDRENWKYAWLTGSTPAEDREKEIHRFTQDPDIHCFFISLKAGGVGLNLTAADYVFILDPWWNPAAEMQALSRAHRIGQKKNVIVYRFISSGTIEEKIRQMQESKSQLAETFITASNPLGQMTRKEVEELLVAD
jgi:superfamily II DNA or RNA helicase